MADLEARWPCPVCLGVRMAKTPVAGAGDLLLDHCPRCGGVWFELGEVSRLRTARVRPLWTRIQPDRKPARMRCHSCGASLSRHDERCAGAIDRHDHVLGRYVFGDQLENFGIDVEIVEIDRGQAVLPRQKLSQIRVVNIAKLAQRDAETTDEDGMSTGCDHDHGTGSVVRRSAGTGWLSGRMTVWHRLRRRRRGFR